MTIILKNDHKRYYRVLQLADREKFSPICEFIAQATVRSLNLYLNFLKPHYADRAHSMSLKALAKISPYSMDYLRKLAIEGKLEAFKEKRNWLSSEKALKDYIKSKKRAG